MKTPGQLALGCAVRLGGDHASSSSFRVRAARRVLPGLASRVAHSLRFPTLPASPPQQASPARLPSLRSDGSAGVNVFGFFSRRFGLGECARLYATALKAVGISVCTIDIEADVVHQRFPESDCFTSAPFHTDGVDLIVANPDVLDSALPQVDRHRGRRHRVGCWFWELESAPTAWERALSHVDELIACSSHVAGALAGLTEKPIHQVPLPVPIMDDLGVVTRSAFGIPASKYLFMASFDFHSTMERKNPLGVISAFRLAFPADIDVVLLMKTANARHYPRELCRVLDAAAGDARIVVRDDLLDAWQMGCLQRCIDAYVSLHRAEGFGLGMAQCMGLGKPVVATGWSGNMDYMDEQCAMLIDFELTPIGRDCAPYTGGRWAAPSIQGAAEAMHRLASDRDYGMELGARARRRVESELSMMRVGTQLARCLLNGRAAPGASPGQVHV